MTTRQAHMRWQGGLGEGNGTILGSSSGALPELPLSWPGRAENVQPGTTSPEELIAAAHASCFAMALAHTIEGAGLSPQHLDVSATIAFEEVNGAWTVTTSALEVTGSVPGADESSFQQLAEQARDNCPVSRALAGNVAISVSASLSSEQLAASAGP